MFNNKINYVLRQNAGQVGNLHAGPDREPWPGQPVCPARGFGHRCKIAHGRPDIGLLQRKFEQVGAEIPALRRQICGLQDQKIHWFWYMWSPRQIYWSPWRSRNRKSSNDSKHVTVSIMLSLPCNLNSASYRALDFQSLILMDFWIWICPFYPRRSFRGMQG